MHWIVINLHLNNLNENEKSKWQNTFMFELYIHERILKKNNIDEK